MGKNNRNNKTLNAQTVVDEEKTNNETGTQGVNNETAQTENDEESDTVKIKVRSLTGKEHYFRAGFRFGSEFEEYEVSREVFKKLKADKWLDVKEA